MSRDAEEKVDAYSHPQVRRGVRDLLKAIAHHIPEGQTATPPMTLDELAITAQHTGRTAQRCRNVLEDVGAIAVHDGGRGKVARYEILNLEGARPAMPAPLPLRADLREATSDRTKEERSGSDLFSDDRASTSDISSDVSDVRVYTVRQNVRRWLLNVGHFFLRWWGRTIKERSRSDILSDVALPQDVDDARARDVLPLKETTTTGPPSDAPRPRAVESPPCGSPRCRYFGTRHAWCAGRVHVPKAFHVEERRKLARQPGETDADLDAQLFARYVEILAAVPETEPIRDRNEFEFWKRVLRSAAAPGTRAPTPSAARRPDILLDRPCPHQPICVDTDACVDRQMAEWRGEQKRQSR